MDWEGGDGLKWKRLEGTPWRSGGEFSLSSCWRSPADVASAAHLGMGAAVAAGGAAVDKKYLDIVVA